jgi:hypothetical protein
VNIDIFKDKIPVPRPAKVRKDGVFFLAMPTSQNTHPKVALLNATARDLYGLADGVRTVGDIMEQFKQMYCGVTDVDLRDDMLSTLKDLEKRGLVFLGRSPQPDALDGVIGTAVPSAAG